MDCLYGPAADYMVITQVDYKNNTSHCLSDQLGDYCLTKMAYQIGKRARDQRQADHFVSSLADPDFIY